MRYVNKYLVTGLLLAVLSMSLIPMVVIDVQRDTVDKALVVDIGTPAKSYVDHDNIIIHGTQDFIDQADNEGWSGDGTEGDPYIISGYRIVSPGVQPFIIKNTDCYFELRDNSVSTGQTYCGIWYENNSHAVIAGNEFHHSHSGMYIVDAVDLLIEDNYIHDNTGSGIEIEEVMTNCTIRNNVIQDIWITGIQVDGGYDSKVYNNTVDRTSNHGIQLKDGSVEIFNNSVSYPGNAGIQLGEGSTGANVYNNIVRGAEDGICILGDDNHVYDNLVYDSSISGIRMDYFSGTGASASGNEIENNCFVNSSGFSVAIESPCSGNEFTNNDFYDSEKSNHVSDNGTDNTFSENFYDTWIGPDSDADGYVDSPYTILGSAENQDLLPLAAPYNPIPAGYEYIPIEMPTSTTGIEDGTPLDIIPIAIIGAVGIIVIGGIIILKRN